MRMYVCLFCRKNTTLIRLKPHKNLYSCPSCIKEKGGRDAAAERETIMNAVNAFHAASARQEQRRTVMA